MESSNAHASPVPPAPLSPFFLLPEMSLKCLWRNLPGFSLQMTIGCRLRLALQPPYDRNGQFKHKTQLNTNRRLRRTHVNGASKRIAVEFNGFDLGLCSIELITVWLVIDCRFINIDAFYLSRWTGNFKSILAIVATTAPIEMVSFFSKFEIRSGCHMAKVAHSGSD